MTSNHHTSIRIIRRPTIESSNNKKFVPKNIVEDFKLNSRTGITSELANYLFKSLNEKKSDKTSMLYQEWEVLFHIYLKGKKFPP